MKTGTTIIIMAIAVVAVVFVLNRGSRGRGSDVDVHHASAYTAADLAFAEPGVKPEPKPPAPKPGKCEICNGTGKVGDGRIMVDCGTCGGDGVVDGNEKATITPPRIDVTVYISNGCALCSSQWEAFGGGAKHEQPIEYEGFRFTPRFDRPNWVATTPTSYFEKNGKWYSIKGWAGKRAWLDAYDNAGKPTRPPSASPPAQQGQYQQGGWHWPDGSPAPAPGPSNNYYGGLFSNCHTCR